MNYKDYLVGISTQIVKNIFSRSSPGQALLHKTHGKKLWFYLKI